MQPAPWIRFDLAHPVRRARTAVVLLAAGVLIAFAGGGPARAAPPDSPITAARFGLSIDGVEIASFSELGSIASSVELAPSTSGAPPGTVIRFARITLLREMTRSIEMWAWHELVARGGPAAARRNATIVAYDKSGRAVARFSLENAWPAKVELVPGEPPREAATIVCEHIQRVM